MRGGRPWPPDRLPRPTTAPAARGLDGFLLQRHVGQKPQGGRRISRWRDRPGFPAWEVTGDLPDVSARQRTSADVRGLDTKPKLGFLVKQALDVPLNEKAPDLSIRKSGAVSDGGRYWV